MPWIAYSINHWEEIKDDVKGFVLRILSKIVNEPEGFSLLNGSDFLLKIHSIMKDLENQKNCIILGYIDVINNLLLHEQGVNWIIDNGILLRTFLFIFEKKNKHLILM